jgi:hypothetical protein
MLATRQLRDGPRLFVGQQQLQRPASGLFRPVPEIPRRSQLSGRCSLVGAVFLFEQMATFVAYLLSALPDLKCIFPISPALVAGLFA